VYVLYGIRYCPQRYPSPNPQHEGDVSSTSFFMLARVRLDIELFSNRRLVSSQQEHETQGLTLQLGKRVHRQLHMLSTESNVYTFS
jgi:hypothetical protein